MFKQSNKLITKRFENAGLRSQITRNSIARRNRSPFSSLNSSKKPTPSSGILAFVGAGFATTIVLSSFANSVYAEGPIQNGAISSSTCPLDTMPAALYNTTDENLRAAKEEFIQLLGMGQVDLDLGARTAHSSTEWSPAPNGVLDRYDIIVKPGNTKEVSEIAKICHRRRIPMTAYSGGTSLEGTLAAVNGGVCIDFCRMNKILTVRKDDLDVTVEPGVGYVDLNQHLASQGLYFPVDPGPGAQIGGMV